MKKEIKVNSLDLTQGSIIRGILLFSGPLIVGNIFQQLYNTVDSVIAGNYIGKPALAAIGSSNSLINLIIGLFMGIATGAGVVIAQYYGAKNEEKMQWAVHTSIVLSIIGGIILTLVGVTMTPQILRWMGTPDSVMKEAVVYLRIFFLGSVFNIVYNMGAGILRGVGDSRRPLYYLCATSVANIILDLIFVICFEMGVAGAAIATIISQGISSVLVIVTLMKDKDIYTLCFRKLRLDKRMTMRILVMGVPTGIQTAVISLSNVIVQAYINSFGQDAIAGSSSYMKIDGFIVLPIMSFGMAAMTFTGQNIGAGKLERVKQGAVKTLLVGCVYCSVMSIVLLVFGREAMKIFSRDIAVIEYGYLMCKILAPFYVGITIAQVMGGVFRGAGKSLSTMLIMVGSMVGIRILWIQVMTKVYPSLDIVLWGYPVSWFFAVLGMVLYAWKGKWLVEQRG
ncbi:MATE family efflux transporter [Lactonifactor longoviformis]|uniref:MATE family efflux transporter n=1 Tax=Lactonifactor longoviformis TaxID=341220 RepID=UPI0036F42BFA